MLSPFGILIISRIFLTYNKFYYENMHSQYYAIFVFVFCCTIVLHCITHSVREVVIKLRGKNLSLTSEKSYCKVDVNDAFLRLKMFLFIRIFSYTLLFFYLSNRLKTISSRLSPDKLPMKCPLVHHSVSNRPSLPLAFVYIAKFKFCFSFIAT